MLVKFALSKEFQKSEFARTGKPVVEKIEGEIHITSDEAAVLVQYNPTGLNINKGTLDGSYNTGFFASTLYERVAFEQFMVHVADKLKEIQEKVEKENKEADERRQKALFRLKEFAAGRPAVILTKSNSSLVGKDATKPDGLNYSLRNFIDQAILFTESLPEFTQELRADIVSEVVRREELAVSREQEKAQKEEDLRVKKELGKVTLESWAKVSGSELLKLRIEEEMNWLEMARKEWILSTMPDGYAFVDTDNEVEGYSFADEYNIKNATVQQIKQLRHERSLLGIANLQLTRKRFDEKFTENGYSTDEQDIIHRDYLEGTVETPDGQEFWIAKFIGDYEGE